MATKTKNAFGLRYVQGGPANLKALLNGILDALNAVHVRTSVDMDARVTPEGTLLTIRNPGLANGARATATTYPLDLTLTDAGSTFTGKFRPGTVNGLIPDNYLSLTGISKTGTVYIGIVCTLANAAIQTATLATGAVWLDGMPTSMGVPPTNVNILTHVIVDGTIFRVLGPGNPWLTPAAIFETDKAGPLSPGEKSTDIWYTYNLTSVV